MDKEKEIKKIVKQIVEGYNPEKIILFGSCVNENKKNASDIDLAVIKNTREKFIERLKRISKIVKTWEALDVLVYTPQELKKSLDEGHYFIEEIIKKGKIIYEK